MINSAVKKLSVALLFIILVSASSVKADSEFTLIYYEYDASESFIFADVDSGVNVTFSIISGVWSGYANVSTSSSGGSYVLAANNSGSIFISATGSTTVKMNGVTFIAPQSFSSGVTYTVTWSFDTVVPSPTAGPSGGDTLPQVDFSWLWLYLYQGDVLGFFQALLVNAFNVIDLVYGVLCLLFLVPLYIKTKSLLLICILWILIGSFFIVVMPLISGLAVVFMVLGVAGLLYRVFVRER